MTWIRKTGLLLNRHGMFVCTCIMIVGLAASIFMLVNDPAETYILFSLLFALIIIWNVCDAEKLDLISKQKQEIADTTDKLILSEHEAERLAIELDAVRAAFKAGERRWGEQAARMKEQANEPEPTTVGTAPSEAPKPRPKRRPVPKRKPKQTENVNENKD